MEVDAALARLAARQHGVVASAQARAAGLTPEQLKRRVADGLLVPVHRGVYRHAAVEDSPAGDLMGAVLACGARAVASHRSAGRVWVLREVPRWRPEVTVHGTARPKATGVVIHRTDTLEAADVARRHGIPVTSVARTLLDLGSLLPPPVLATTTEDACIRNLVSPIDLVATLERLGRPGRRGAAALRAVVAGLVPPEDLDSRLEHDLLRLIRASGVPPPVPQLEAVVGGGRRVKFDFAWPDRRTVVEADGRRWHATSAEFERDLAGHNAITTAGWRLFRYGWADVHQRPDATRAASAAAVRRAGAA
jgi:Transcriptional regulator, AbiEi antitoxin